MEYTTAAAADPRPSLPEAFASVRLPAAGAPGWRRMLAFAGPGLLVAVGYMDPGQLGDRFSPAAHSSGICCSRWCSGPT